MHEMAREMERTTFVKKVITDVPAREVLRQAQAYFIEQGYRASPGGRPDTLRLMGRSEGLLPAVIGELGVRTTNKGRTIVSFSGYGERLSERLKAFHEQMRAARAPKATRPVVPPARTESRAEELEELALEAAEAEGADAAEAARERERFEGGAP